MKRKTLGGSLLVGWMALFLAWTQSERTGAARVLTDKEMEYVLGGTIDVCQSQVHSHPDMRCNPLRSFDCTNICDFCPAQGPPGEGGCTAFVCWNCANGPVESKLRECNIPSSKGCAEFGGPHVCGGQQQAQCVWVNGACMCELADLRQVDPVCWRADCL